MNEASLPAAGEVNQYTQFVWRRLEEPMQLGGWELPPAVWLILLLAVAAFCAAYVIFMYVMDSRSVGVVWATLLGTLRLSIYALLALVFLLPARQTFIETRSEGKVLVLFDVSGSMGVSDELPGASATPETRQDRVIAFLTDAKADFINSLEKKNPVTAYRFGSKLDGQTLHFAAGRVFTRQEKDNPDRDPDGAILLPPVQPVSAEYLSAWLNPSAVVEPKPELTGRDKARLEKLAGVNAGVVKEGLASGTNLGDSLLGALEREASNRLQGIVVFTDGRNTESSASAFANLEARARDAKVPVFVVGVGEDRQKVKIEIADVRLPGQVQPDDQFRMVAELVGEGLSGATVDLTVEVTHVRKDKKGVEQLLPITAVEAEGPDAKATRASIDLGTRVTLRPAAPVKFSTANPPRAEVEFQLDAKALAAAARVDLDARLGGKKWEIGETKDDSALVFQVRVPADRREGLQVKDHLSDKQELRVLKKPLRVLIFASSASREYQFVETQLAREFEKKRLELAVHLQLPPGEVAFRGGRVQDVPPERLLPNFPDSFEAKTTLMDLSSYDVIVAFDPDWDRLSTDQIKMVQAWSERGGGLIYVGGYINTVELIRPREGDRKLQPVLDMLPVELDDRRDRDRASDAPFPLDFEGATPEMEFLRLDEEMDEAHFKDDWNAYFYGEEPDRKAVERGFFNFYPVKKAKLGSVVVARYGDPSAKLPDGTLHPFLVLSKPGQQRVVWLASAETWRLREYRQTYFERFWSKLVHYAGANSQNKVNRRVRIEMGKQFTAGKNVEVETEIFGAGGQVLERTAKPEITLLKYPTGVSEKDAARPLVLRARSGRSDGWFNGRFLVKVPGEYEMQMRVPETGDTQTQRFSVKEANPELDDTRPDFVRMYRLASEAEGVFNRMGNDADKALVRRRLVKPKLDAAGAEPADKADLGDDKPRLYFDLKNADAIPLCMLPDVKIQTSKGPVEDLWDKGVEVAPLDSAVRWFLGLFGAAKPADPGAPPPEPLRLPHFLLLAVGLLSLEWLIRKLLRLA